MHLNIAVERIINVVGGETSIDPSFLIEKISSLENAGPKDIAILFDHDENSIFPAIPKEVIEKSNAGLIIASKQISPLKNYLVVKDPLTAYQKIVNFIYESAKDQYPNINHLASISKSATIGEGTKLEAFVLIDDEAKIGSNCHFKSHVYIGKNCSIGNNVFIHPGVKVLDRCIIGDNSIIHANAVIGSDGFGYRASKMGLNKIPHVGIVRIGKNVEIGASTCIDRAAFEETVIGDGVKMDNLVHISHNVKVGAHSVVLAQTAIAGSVTTGMGCQIGAQVAIKDHVKIGNNVKIVAKTGIMKNLEDGEIVAGIPSMPFNKWKRLVVTLGNIQEIISQVQELRKYAEKLTAKKRWWHRIFAK